MKIGVNTFGIGKLLRGYYSFARHLEYSDSATFPK